MRMTSPTAPTRPSRISTCSASAASSTCRRSATTSGKPQMKGEVTGNLDVDATVANVSKGVTVDSVQARADVTLDPSNIGGLQITRAHVDGDYRDSSGEIRALEIVGRDLNVQ